MLIGRPDGEQADVLSAPTIASMQKSDVSRVCLLPVLGAERRLDLSLRQVELLPEQSGMPWAHMTSSMCWWRRCWDVRFAPLRPSCLTTGINGVNTMMAATRAPGASGGRPRPAGWV